MITIGKIKKDVEHLISVNNIEKISVNAYDEFITEYKEINEKLSETLKNDSEDVKKLITTLDEVIDKILNYRYNIIDHLNYCDNDDYYLSHKYLKI